MATITYRKLDTNGDPIFGRGRDNFVSDLEAVAQAVGTRLKLFLGEWWESRGDGTPVFQSMLGSSVNAQRPELIALLLKQRIAATPYVTNVSNIVTGFDHKTRVFTFSCQVETPFGTLTVTT